MASAQRISIGFQASPPIALRVPPEELERLNGALGGEGWFDLVGEDGTLKLSLPHVLLVRVERDLDVSEAIRPGRWHDRPLVHRAAERALGLARREL